MPIPGSTPAGTGPEPASVPPASGQPTRTPPPAPAAQREDRPPAPPEEERTQGDRRRAAVRAARRVLHLSPAALTVREGLARLLTYTGLPEPTAETDAKAGTAPDADPYGLDEQADFYGNGIVARLEQRVAQLLGTEAALFFPTGTMAQQVALRCWAGRTGNSTVALHPLAHPEMYERNALSVLSGLRTVHPTTRPRLPTPEEIHALPEPFGSLLLELPLREAGFVLPTWEELTATVEAAREREAVVHFDGARLWESATHFGRQLHEIAGLADSVYVSFYKSLGGLGGAALAGPHTLIEEATAWRHRYGGQLFQQYPTVLSALAGLDHELPRMPEYVAGAQRIARALDTALAKSDAPWWRIHPQVPHTHQFQLWLPYEAEALEEASIAAAEETGTAAFWGWGTPVGAPPRTASTEVTVTGPGLDWTQEEVDQAVRDLLARLP